MTARGQYCTTADTSLCLKLLEIAQHRFEVNRADAAWMIIKILRAELSAESPGARPN